MRSIGERALVAMRTPLQRGQVARMSDRENVGSNCRDVFNRPVDEHLEYIFLCCISLVRSGPILLLTGS